LTEHRLPDSNINRSAYDAMNRRTTETLFDGRTVTYSYTATGMRASATDERGSTTYAYDALDRLIGVSLPTGMTAGYAYDADGRRVESLLGSQVTHSLWDEASQYGDVILETDGDGDVLASYVLGGMNLLSQTHAGETSYFSRDALGSTRALTDASGTVTDTYSYTAFGELFAQTGSTTNRYLFTGQQYDPATGLYSMRARYYDPSVGRFLTRDTFPVNYNDPVELNRYGYVANDPVNAIDPTGMLLVETGAQTRESAAHAQAQAIVNQAFVSAARRAAIRALILIGPVVAAPIFVLVSDLFRGLLEEVLLSSPSPTTDISPETNPDAQSEGTQPDTKTDERDDEEENRILLYHYTFAENMPSILAKGLRPSLRPPLGRDAHHGEGQYLTDLTPEESSTTTRFRHAYALTTGRFYWGPPPNPPRPVGWIEFAIPRDQVKYIQPLFGRRFPHRSIYLYETALTMPLVSLGFTGRTGIVIFQPSRTGIR
jgi:RHS repeat-associated protein